MVWPQTYYHLMLLLVGITVIRIVKRLTLEVGLLLGAVRTIQSKVVFICGSEVILRLLINHGLGRIGNWYLVTNILTGIEDR